MISPTRIHFSKANIYKATTHHAKGFTLIETMMGLLVMAAALGPLVILAQTSWDVASDKREQSLAHWVAMNYVTELQLQGIAPDEGTVKQTVEMADTTWAVTATTTQSPNELIRRIVVNVTIDEDNKSVDDALATVNLFLPTIDPTNLPPELLERAARNAGSDNNQNGNQNDNQNTNPNVN